MLRKLIHILFLPCSKATMLMEKRNAQLISRKEDWQLSMHLKICKWCRAYEEKLKILDDILKRKLSQKEKNEINTSDIQEFKNKVLEKLDL
ncbi:hypothetical protein EG346_23710 [Chryseobacterium carnipullorum]|uniref:Zf-HC2 domain-containing protein n=1 Tax=Chryseobacterium carnipullorum TaxID=1124835 RepID=A0A376E733_CHRCU|nr:hypothetical protein [Chryseobacterium carnipullorum]AZA50997.1 hypothetical protein EG346_23710 [Chryseobacterium carnipullorum]AZA65859.1 hypothetical protein EG345_14815 [Chryseobacterium carnipullorum]STD03687.1 Uncharacterised protein [Chryseobacterium carnipullorum]